MDNWNHYIKEQKDICDKYQVAWADVDINLFLGLADNVMTSEIPINGLRHPAQGTTCGWYIWTGMELSDRADFFKPVCVKHLVDIRPEVIKFLGLPPGYRFLTDDKGHIDIWEDKKLLDV